MDLRPGEIHAVLGENGAGKSTLMHILAGEYEADSGEILVQGVPTKFGSAADARRAGIGMVHQHFMLVPAFTVAENLAMTTLDRLGSSLDLERRANKALTLGRELGWELDPNALTGQLAVGEQQRLEIVRLLATDAEVLIFDEPTAVLSPGEVEELSRVLRQLRDAGRTVALIAHKLSEIMAVADRVTVLRRGKFIATAPISEVDEGTLATWMVGELPAPPAPPVRNPGEIAVEANCLVVDGDRGEVAAREVDISVRHGEIFGIGGVDGNGQSELAEALAGLRRVRSGTLNATKNVAYIPQDRQRQGLALGMSIEDNLTLGVLDREGFVKAGWLQPQRIRGWAERMVAEYAIKVGNLRDAVSTLSGGNQQKVIVSRIVDAGPEVLVALNPTRGLDFRAAEFVQQQLVRAAERGCAVILFTTDLDELQSLCDRYAIMSRGELRTGELAATWVGGSG